MSRFRPDETVCGSFEPHAWKKRTCRECLFSEAEHRGATKPRAISTVASMSAIFESKQPSATSLTSPHRPSSTHKNHSHPTSQRPHSTPPSLPTKNKRPPPLPDKAGQRVASRFPPPLPPKGQRMRSASFSPNLHTSRLPSRSHSPLSPPPSHRPGSPDGDSLPLHHTHTAPPKRIPANVHVLPAKRPVTSSRHTKNAYSVPQASRKNPLFGAKQKDSVPLVGLDAFRTSTASTRLVDYFLVFGLGEPKNKQPVPATLFDVEFSAELLTQYPATDWGDSPLSPNVFMFAFPQTVAYIPCQHQREHDPLEASYDTRRPYLFHFVLTGITGNRQYATCLRFTETLKKPQLTETLNAVQKHLGKPAPTGHQLKDELRCDLVRKKVSIHRPKCLCLLSSQPLNSLFREFLKHLYHTSMYPSPYPVERLLINFIHEIPVPPPGATCVSYNIDEKAVRVGMPALEGLPVIDVDMTVPFRCLSPQVILAVLAAMATEQKIVMCSSKWTLPYTIAEAFRALLFPLTWQGVYMPLLPDSLVDFMFAPVPFIAGIHSSYLDYIDKPVDVVFLDIDANELLVPSDYSMPVVPPKEHKKLLAAIYRHCDVFQEGSAHGALKTVDQAFPDGSDLFPPNHHAVPPVVDNFDLDRITAHSPCIVHTATDAHPSRQLAPPGLTHSTSSPVLLSSQPSGGLSYLSQKASQVASIMQSAVGAAAGGISNVVGGGGSQQVDIQQLREAFLEFWVRIFGKYRQHLITGADGHDTFDEKTWINEQPKPRRAFLTLLTETQMLSSFLRDVREGDESGEGLAYVCFFDKCIAELTLKKSSRKERKDKENVPCRMEHFIGVAPLSKGLTNEMYQYEAFPTNLNEKYLKDIRQVEILTRGTRVRSTTGQVGGNKMDKLIVEMEAMLAFDATRVRKVTQAYKRTKQPAGKQDSWASRLKRFIPSLGDEEISTGKQAKSLAIVHQRTLSTSHRDPKLNLELAQQLKKRQAPTKFMGGRENKSPKGPPVRFSQRPLQIPAMHTTSTPPVCPAARGLVKLPPRSPRSTSTRPVAISPRGTNPTRPPSRSLVQSKCRTFKKHPWRTNTCEQCGCAMEEH